MYRFPGTRSLDRCGLEDARSPCWGRWCTRDRTMSTSLARRLYLSAVPASSSTHVEPQGDTMRLLRLPRRRTLIVSVLALGISLGVYAYAATNTVPGSSAGA